MKRIAITGPESTGKTSLAEALAKHYKTVWNPEYAREYLEKLGKPYVHTDIEKIAKEQIKHEDALCKHAKSLMICDTELIVIKVWMEFKYKKCPEWILKEIHKRKYDLYLLCNIDFPWIPDALREHPNFRAELFNIYKNELDQITTNYMIISGKPKERIKQAIDVIDRML